MGISKDLIKQTNYSGFIMIEFLFDVNKNKYYVIEINPRPWGSILLSEFCNSNMIYSYLNYDNMISKVNIYYIKWILPHLIFRAFKGKLIFLNTMMLPVVLLIFHILVFGVQSF